jgi:hypothetical protein
MNNFNSNTDWVRNKNSDAIVYRHADGDEVITRATAFILQMKYRRKKGIMLIG